MAASLRVLIDFEALDALPRSGKRRRAVISFLKGLSEFAHLGGDFEVTDPETSRKFQVSCVAGFAITWWIDQAVREVK